MPDYTSSSATATFWTTPSNKKYGVRIQFGEEEFVAENSPVSTSFSPGGWQGEVEGTLKYTKAADLKTDVPSAYKISYVARTEEVKAHLLVKLYSIDSAGKESETYYAEVRPLLSFYVLALIQFTSSTPGVGNIVQVSVCILARSLLTMVHSRRTQTTKRTTRKPDKANGKKFPEPSFSAYFKANLDKYKEMTPAAALIYGGVGWGEGSVCVVAPAILKEFIDGVEFGKDPEGTLFFNDIKDLDSNSYYNAFNISGGGVVLQFYANLESTDSSPRTRTVPGDGVSVVKRAHGKNSKAVPPPLMSKSRPTNQAITITINAIGKTVKFPVELGDTVINIRGNLLFKNLSKLTSGTTSFVNYHDDRIIFLPKSGSKDFTAVFIPTDKPEESPFFSSDFESNAADATWSDSTQAADYSLSYKGKFTYKAGTETNADKENIYMTFPTGIHQDGSYCLIFSTFTKTHTGSLKVPIVVKSQPVFNGAKTSFTILTDYYTWKGTTTDDWKTVTIECWCGSKLEDRMILLTILGFISSARWETATIMYPSRFLLPSRCVTVMPFINLYVLLLWVLNMTEREAGEPFYSEGLRAGSLSQTTIGKIIG
ncbi:hypothetical protein B0H16DRAFT_1484125 [Mycena metata]|uniref:Uncharacterized protein n=1 Tax=Mycena metata TaxID=1033252 RepID=A0AAD7DWP7_9AGAR|nr:hypothetical protein B0H16DRAFT_1484125 [Mycena metata]